MSPRRPLPSERASVTKRFNIGEAFQGYATVGLYEGGLPGELFIVMHKVGSVERGMCDQVARLVSAMLQHGFSVDFIAAKLVGQRYEPAGRTGDAEFPVVTSFSDYLGRWLRARFGGAVSEVSDAV